jgi:hypothetical protein
MKSHFLRNLLNQITQYLNYKASRFTWRIATTIKPTVLEIPVTNKIYFYMQILILCFISFV